MLKGIYTAASGMTSQLMMGDMNADNIANINTIGYKRINAKFQSYLSEKMNSTDPAGSTGNGSEVSGTRITFDQGDLMTTGNPLDVAINGEGWFTIKNPEKDDVAYTRAGNFTRDAQGYLVTLNGYRVQGKSGDIQIPPSVKTIQILETGEVSLDGKSADSLKIAQFEDNNVLKRQGYSMYKTDVDPKDAATDLVVLQGTLERSNANVIEEMVTSMNGMRTYESLQKTIQMQNETLGKAVNEVGRTG